MQPSSVPAPMEAVTPEEWAAGEIKDQAKLARIRQHFLSTGVAVVQNVVPEHVLDAIGARLDHDAAHQVVGDALGTAEAYRAASGHLACGLPRNSPHVHPEVVSNPILEQLVVVCLGGAAFMRYYNGNTSLRECPAHPRAATCTNAYCAAVPPDAVPWRAWVQPALSRRVSTWTGAAGASSPPRRRPPPTSRGRTKA